MLGHLSRLQELNLKGCYKVADAGMAALAHLRSLRALNLQECWQITAAGLAHLSGNPPGQQHTFLKVYFAFCGSMLVCY